MELSKEQISVLAYVVVDPQAWLDHAVTVFGDETAVKHLAAKVGKHKATYESAVKLPDYKTRAERDAAEGM